MRGRPRKSPTEGKMAQVGIRVETWLMHQLKEVAKKQERTVTQIIRHAVKEYLERQKAA